MSEWWCQYCNSVVHPEDVTYEETHDPRSGGCGGAVQGGKFTQRVSLEQRIAELEAVNNMQAGQVRVRDKFIEQLEAEVKTKEDAIAALRKQVAKMPVVVGYVDYDCLDYLRRNCGEEDITVRKARCDIYSNPVYIDPPHMESGQ